MRIIIVDDDMGTLNALKAYLVSTGHDVLTARDGTQALYALHSSTMAMNPVDILITDLKMDGMNGYELIQEVKKSYLHLPTVLMTAYGDSRVREQAANLDHSAYLDKPFSPERLTRTLFELTSRNSSMETG